MPIVTAVPGIYIEEDASPAISVSSGATAIPLFIGRFSPLDSQYSGVVTRISGWLDFCQKFSVNTGVTASAVIDSTPDKAEAPTKYTYSVKTTTATIYAAALMLQLYFQNGGGPCYLFPLDDASGTEGTAALAALPDLADGVGEITLFAVLDNDDAYSAAVYDALSGVLDQNKGYFLLVDSRDGEAPSGIASSSHIGIYYPPLNVSTSSPLMPDDASALITGYVNIDEKITADNLAELTIAEPDLAAEVMSALVSLVPDTLSVPPSALIAGVYAKTDRERGVWKAPANVALSGVSDVSVRVTDDTQGEMNQAGINVIRYFPEKGFVVWGARTLQDDDNWRYIPVRRLFDAAERDIKKALRPMVFEPNNQLTWKRVQAAIDHYLYRLWEQGGLAGNKADEAYFVRIGKGTTMTVDDINQGKMIIQMGMAAVRPAEFIVLQFTQDMAQ